jgi:ferritin-like metal-binding protein YciE
MPDSASEQLLKHLTDAHAIEEQALVQLRRAGGIAGAPELAAIFERHLPETERHEELVRERIEAHGADASTVKDAAGKAGAFGMVLFAKANPDTPGKLAVHAYSYENMELAAYELLRRVAERAADESTAAVAREIGAEESSMAGRLEDAFDVAVAASLGDGGVEEADEQLDGYLADAHAIEQQAISLLEGGVKIAGEEGLERAFAEHLAETREHASRLEQRLDARGSSPSKVKDLGLRLGGFGHGAFFGAQPDSPMKLAGFAYAFEHLEIGAYELLGRVADRASDPDTAELASIIAAEERAAAERIASRWDAVVDATLALVAP